MAQSHGWDCMRYGEEELLGGETQVPSHQSNTFVFIFPFFLFILVFLLQGKKGSWESGLRLVFPPRLGPSSQLFLACLLLFLPLFFLFLLDWIGHWDVQWGFQIAQVGFIECWLLV